MALPTNIPAALRSYAVIVQQSKRLKSVADARNTGWKSGGAAGTNLDQLSVLLAEIRESRNAIQPELSTPGVQAVFRLATGDDLFDLTAEMATLNTLANAATAALLAAIPTDGVTGASLLFAVDQDGIRTHLHPDQADLDAVTAAVDALVAGIA
jgi:hypothetical protein